MGTRKHPGVTWVDRSFEPGDADTFSVSSLQNSLTALSEATPFVGDTFPGTPQEGDVWVDPARNVVQVYFDGAWGGLGAATDVRMYGVKGDGTTDDSAKLQVAVNAAAAGSGVLDLVAGASYFVPATVLIPSNVRINGHSSKTVIKAWPGTWAEPFAVAPGAVDVHLVDLLFDGMNTPTANGKTGPLLSLGRGSCRVTLERVRYRNLGTPAINAGTMIPGGDRGLYVAPGACPPVILGGDTGEPSVVPFTAWRPDVETTSLWVQPTLHYGGTYQPGDYVGPSGPNGILCSNASNVSGGGGTLVSLTVIDSDNQGVPMDIYVFSDWGINVPDDNLPWQIGAVGARKCCGLIQVNSYMDFGAVQGKFGFGVFPQGPIPYQCHLTEFYFAVVTRGGPTYSQRGLDFRLGIFKDTMTG